MYIQSITFMYTNLLRFIITTEAVVQTPSFKDIMEKKVAAMWRRLFFMDSLYEARLDDLIKLQGNVGQRNGTEVSKLENSDAVNLPEIMPPKLKALVTLLSVTRAAEGFHGKHVTIFKAPYVYQLMPHLLSDASSLRPIYHMRGNRTYAEVVIGIPHYHRDNVTYLIPTLSGLIYSISEEERKNILIIVFVGETDLEFVFKTARSVENVFWPHVESGLIEILSPAASYYFPSASRDWYTKQNLDAIYLMTYARTKGTYFLLMEDDMITTDKYLEEMQQFITITTLKTPNWFVLSFSSIPVIGKLMKTMDLKNFILYIQLFYKHMPLEVLIQNYLADLVCTEERLSSECSRKTMMIGPQYTESLFGHVGRSSTLHYFHLGKIQKNEG